MQFGLKTAALVLGSLCVIGPMSIDLYLPALPMIGERLGASASTVQASLPAYFLAFGISQLFYGPWADAAGRRQPIAFGLALFIVASIGCAMAPSIHWLIAFRVLQGLGASAAMVIPRAIIRDMYTGVEATKLMAMVMLVISVAPMLAPMIGSLLIGPFGWRSVFIVIAAVAIGVMVMVWKVLPETLPPERRKPIRVSQIKQSMGTLLTDPYYMGLILIGGLGMSSFFAFLSSAPYLYTERYGLSPSGFSIAFAINAMGFFGMSQLASRFGERFGIIPVVRVAVAGFAAGGALLLTSTLMGMDNIYGMGAILFVTYACLGLVVPMTMVLALDANGTIAGTASSLAGTVQTVMGAAMMSLVAAFFNGTPMPMVLMIAACSFGALALSELTLRRATEVIA